MYKFLIQDIEKENNKILDFCFNDEIPELKAKIKADLKLASLGDFIKITGHIAGTIELVCDMCLQKYNHKLDFPIEEVFAKNALFEEYGQETEIKEGQFITDLNGAEEIDIYDLLYQSVILQLPNKKVCGINCIGDKFLHDEKFIQDERMAVFKSIKIEK